VKTKHLLLLICFLFHAYVEAQNNIDFEYGHFTNWWGAYNNDTCGVFTPNPLNRIGIDTLGSQPKQVTVSTGNDPSVNLFSLPLKINASIVRLRLL
jgi:hypothetical protein